MKKSISLLFTFFFVLLFNSTNSFAQDVLILTQKKTIPERAAEGQTKWLRSNLKYDETTAKVVYEIFLKYELEKESIRVSDSLVEEKKDLHLLIAENIKTDLSKVLSPLQYNTYLILIADQKDKSIFK